MHPAAIDRFDDPVSFALDLAEVVRALQAVPTDGAPPAGNRARPLAEYDGATRWAIDRASHLIDAEAATAVWEDALAAPPYDGPAVWVQGDLEGNCLAADGRLCGIVDWGSAGLGDPAVDVQVIWSPLFSVTARQDSSTSSASTTPPSAGVEAPPSTKHAWRFRTTSTPIH